MSDSIAVTGAKGFVGVHLLGPLATSVDVVRNDAITTDEVLASAPDAIVLSPGPCSPNEAGI